jgi:hypothetical protein
MVPRQREKIEKNESRVNKRKKHQREKGKERENCLCRHEEVRAAAAKEESGINSRRSPSISAAKKRDCS